MIQGYSVYVGDAAQRLRELGDQSVHCIVTSPPYYHQRDYGHADQIGQEQSPSEYIANLINIFDECYRVLRDDGVMFLNLGDTYQDKQLMGIPWRTVLAMKQGCSLTHPGWNLRQELIWHKTNAMPESVKNRFTKAHEHVFMLTKGDKYYFDQDAAKEPAVKGAAGSHFDKGKTAIHQHGRASSKERTEDGMRNRRSVWPIATSQFKEAHFATFPPALVEPMILAGCPDGGVVLDPFGGSGTVAGVALRHNRNAIVVELNPEYAAMIDGRIGQIRGNDA